MCLAQVFCHCRPYYRDEPPSPEYRSPSRPDEYRPLQRRPSSTGSKGHRSGHRGRAEMSPISERAYDEGPAAEYYRRYKSPVRSRTMDELDMRDLNQTSIPYDSTVHTHPAKSPHIPPPNAISTPHRSSNSAPQYSSQSQHPAQQYTGQSQPPAQQYTGQPQQPAHNYAGQSQQPIQYGAPPPQTTYMPQGQYHQQPLQQTSPVQQVPVQPPVYQIPTAVTSYPVVQATPPVAAVPMQQTVTSECFNLDGNTALVINCFIA